MKEGVLKSDFKPGQVNDCGVNRNEEGGIRAWMLWGRDGFEEFVEYLNGVNHISTHAYTIGSLMTYSGRISILSKTEKVIR